ncbi:uncharacterized protein LOC110454170 [Mizuhopecten yessoensis]|uniref:uncharacterized protein LOC110454170 n=1 Tax=Mizuhopecten yessoensis TaxID=6573 RepID=UPI000B45800F|nr:uncharacterized protein LOC110454170 [Mizuhopecten yessoensis]
MGIVPVHQLAESLGKFYCEARPLPKNENDVENLYHRNSLISIRAAINRHLSDIHRNVDIVRDTEFKTPNGILDGLLKQRTRLGLSKPVTHKEIIDQDDLEKMSSYFDAAPYSPVILRQYVWYVLAVHFLSRGMEFHHQLKPDSFVFESDSSGEYATLSHETQQKNIQGGLSHSGENGKRMYASGNSKCPVKMLKRLIEKTDPTATSLFNQFDKSAVMKPIESAIWYTNKSLSKRTFAKFMSNICVAAKIDKKYTPHCLRATAIQFLNDQGYEARHIMYMSDHRCESSLRSYNRNVANHQKKALSSSLSAIVQPKAKHGVLEVQSYATSPPSDLTVSLPNLPVSSGLIPNTSSLSQVSVRSTNNFPPGFFSNSTFSGCTITVNNLPDCK